MTIRTSGFDPQTGICWQFRNKGDRRLRCRCPACSAGRPELAYFGRCRSGRRWFWSAKKFDGRSTYGWAETEELAMAAAMAAVQDFCTGLPIVASVCHGWTSEMLKELNETKRRQRPAPDTSDAHPVEYLYSELYRFHVVRKTKQRIYYNRTPLPLEESSDDYLLDDRGIGFINRQKIEQQGEIWSHRGGGWWEPDCRLYLAKPPPTTKSEGLSNLSELKAAMAAAHPDRGGSNAEFIAARARYVAARKLRPPSP
jgi:hypothetical protein